MIFSVQSFGKTLKIAVIDTGISQQYFRQPIFCKKGHKSFIPRENIFDRHGHGTNIAGLITKSAGNSDYCIISIKFYTRYMRNITPNTTLIAALRYAYKLKPDIIHFSGGGVSPINTEKEIVEKILNAGIIFNVAAGNESMNLDYKCDYFPACYDKRINVIGAYDVSVSNKGKIVDKYLSGLRKTAFGITQTGTSQAAAIFTGKMIKKMGKKK